MAVRLFADNGYQDTTLKHIAKAADLTPGAFYYHFDSKEDLAAEIIDQGWPRVTQALDEHLRMPGAGLENVIAAAFAVIDTVNRDKMQWISFHLAMAIGHMSPQGRKSYRKQVETLSAAMLSAFQDGEIRDGVTREEAGELLWITMTGTQLMSDALEQTGPVMFNRLGRAWKSALSNIVPDELFPRLAACVDETAAKYASEQTPALIRSA